MSYKTIFGALLLSAGCVTLSQAAGPVSDTEIGLSKTSVFDTPTPNSWTYTKQEPENVDRLPRAFPGAPPQIPHEVASMLPIKSGENLCVECHDNPRYIGKGYKNKSPMPESHYAVKGEKVSDWKMSGARFNCTQCHAPQAEGVKPLVGNTFTNVGK